MAKESFSTSQAVHPFPLTDLIYGIVGLTFLHYKSEGLTQIARDLVYAGLKALADSHLKYFSNVYFTQRGSLMHSKEVEDALSRLGGVLNTQGLRHQYLCFKESELGQVEKKLNKWFAPDKREVIKKLAAEFYQEVKNHLARNISP